MRLRHSTRHPGHPVLGVVAVVVAAALGFGVVYYQTLSTQLESAISTQDVRALVPDLPAPSPTASPDPEDLAAGQPVNILLMGSDQRDGRNGDIGGATDVTGMRNDTTIIMHIAGDRSRVELVSIPRDAQVAIPDCTLFDGTVVKGWTGDFNIAFANGGRQGDPAEAAACTIHTVQTLTGISIDHYAVVDFAGFQNMVDAIGGVPVCIPERIVGIDVPLRLDAGPQVLDGRDALSFARLRKAEVGDVSGSDLQRITRQQYLLKQTFRTALGKNLLTDLGELTQFIRAGAESLSTNPELGDVDTMRGLAWSLRDLDVNNIVFATAPWEYTPDFLDVELLPESRQMWDDLRHDRPITVDDDVHASAEWVPGGTAEPAPAPSNGGEPTRSSVDDLLAECTA